ncbi:MAG: AlpA family phage regulatory protein [Methylococcales bacterium]|nr:AlpA family phage regulatory protein [Methylococcales bacterium]MDD5754372.1 AlpA family phage regulatory protein [Methylococcales bacterium]
MAKRIPSTYKSPNNENKSIDTTAAEFLRIKDLIMFLTLSSSTIRRKVRDGSFPKPVQLSQSITAWRVSEIREWIKNVGNDSALNTSGNIQ